MVAASIWCGRAQAIGQRLELVAVAGGEQQMGAFLGKGFGRGRANAFRGAGDEDAFAAQMKIHGIARKMRGLERMRGIFT